MHINKTSKKLYEAQNVAFQKWCMQWSPMQRSLTPQGSPDKWNGEERNVVRPPFSALK